MLKLSANLSMLFQELPCQDRVAAAAAAGFAAVEIQFPYTWERAALKQALCDHQLPLALINLPAGDLMQGGPGLACVPGCDDEFTAALRTACLWAEDLQVAQVNILAGRRLGEAAEADQERLLIARIKQACRQLQALGVGVCVEAINSFDMPNFFIDSLEKLQRLLIAVDEPNLRMQLDVYHLGRMGEDIAAVLRRHIAHTGHIQFADVPGRGAPGSGSIDWSAFFSLMQELPYEGYCGAEYRVTAASTVATLSWIPARV